MEYDESFIQEEIRCGFTVTEKRKKVWYIELELLKKFDQVCQKHHLTYYADYGTLLGAVRHKGFIPWDDDIDVAMFRDDYAKFQKIAPEEFKEPYLYQDSYNGEKIWCISKIRDKRTTAIEFLDVPVEYNQGMFIDINPIDDAPDDTLSSRMLVEMKKEVWMTIVEPETMLEHLQKKTKFMLDADILYELLGMPIRERFRQFEDFNLSNMGKSKNVGFISRTLNFPDKQHRKREWYADLVYLPFENITVPAPADYDKILKFQYGDYSIYRKYGSTHTNIFMDPDKPYIYYMQYHPDKIKMDNRL